MKQRTQVFGILGWPVEHSLSPAMHSAAFLSLSLDAVYLRFAVSPTQLADAVRGCLALGIDGFNVTLPHKQAIVPLLDGLSVAARAIGAVNTVHRQGAQLLGDNTDALGLQRSLAEAQVPLAGCRAVVLGAGGAARAAVYALAAAGARHIRIAARQPQQSQALVAALQPHLPAATPATAQTTLLAIELGAPLADAFATCDLLVQATSATLAAPHDDAASAAAQAFVQQLPLVALPPHATVTDLVYAPRQTALLQAAAARGHRTVDGLGMLLHQGAVAWEAWMHHPAPLDTMRQALLAALA